ncbi:Ger(x)C family spore germination protein [Pontibacillus salicampi]|uniref:Ger(X)C family spore germination protein n=1 Tax=Pontibacillus salicampi TaxID=1449801 RepID=A0ABV6LQD6_9BACI
MIKKSKVILYLLFLFLLTGCTGAEELNIQAIVTAVGFDKGEDDQILTHFQIVYPGGSTARQGSAPIGGQGNAVYTYTIAADSMLETVDKARNLLPRKLFFPHIQIIIFGEDFARDVGFSYLVDYMERDNEIRDEIMVFTAKEDTAENILSSYTSLTANPSVGIIDRVNNTFSPMGLMNGIFLEEVIKWTYGERRDPVTMGIERSNPESESGNKGALDNIYANQNAFDLTGIPLYKGEYLLDWLSIKESKGWSLINDRVKKTLLITAPCPEVDNNSTFGFLIKDSKTKKEATIKGNQVDIAVSVTGRGILRELKCDGKVEDPAYLNKLKKAINEQMEMYMRQAVVKTKENQVDSFGFGQYLYRNNPNGWRQIEENWDSIYVDSTTITPNVHIDITGVGTRRKSTHEPDQIQ